MAGTLGNMPAGKTLDLYELRVKGRIDDRWLEWLEGVTIRHAMDDNGSELSIIHARVADQPALHGLIARIRDLNLTLVSVRRVPDAEPQSLNRDQHEHPGSHPRHPRIRRVE